MHFKRKAQVYHMNSFCSLKARKLLSYKKATMADHNKQEIMQDKVPEKQQNQLNPQ